MELVQMTSEELEMMTALYSDTQRLQEGRLYPAEQEALKQYRSGIQYLEEKYPDAAVQVLSFSPATKLTTIGQFELQASNGERYNMTLTPSEDAYILEDNYYGALLREEYDRYVTQLLEEYNIECQSFTVFHALRGMEIGSNTTVPQLISARLPKMTDLFVKTPTDPEALQILLRDNGLYGSYQLYTVPEEEYTDAPSMEANRKSWTPVSFNCFDTV